MWVEAPVEPQHDGNRTAADSLAALQDGIDVEIDRLLAQHGQTVRRGTRHEVDVGRCRRGDDDAVEVVYGEDLCWVFDCPCTGAIREFTGAVDERIGDHHQVDVGVCGDAAGMNLTDSAGAEQGQSQFGLGHDVLSLWVA